MFSPAQLRLYLETPEQLEAELGFPVSRAVVTERVRRAIGKKLAKMAQVEGARQLWFTYWLIVVRGVGFGAGLLGFRDEPQGQVETGYGIDPAYQNKGYITEAVRKMIAWAFADQACLAIVAPGVERANLASQRVLHKAGMSVYEEAERSLSYRIQRGISPGSVKGATARRRFSPFRSSRGSHAPGHRPGAIIPSKLLLVMASSDD